MKIHSPFPTVSTNYSDTKPALFKPMQVVSEQHHGPSGYIQMGVVIMGPLYVPYFEDGCASAYSRTPLDITNPTEWDQTFKGYIVYDLVKQDYQICAEHNLSLFELDYMSAYIPGDLGSGQLRGVLGLIELGRKCAKNK